MRPGVLPLALAGLLLSACEETTDHFYACQGEHVCTVLQTEGILIDEDFGPEEPEAFKQTCLREEAAGAFREADSAEGGCDDPGEMCFWLHVVVDGFRIRVTLYYREEFEDLTGVEPVRHCMQMRAL